MSILFRLITTIQETLFPVLEKELAAPLGEKGELFVTVVELVQPERFIERFEWRGLGCPRKWRLPILHSFIAKAVWNLATTRALLERLAHDASLRRLCGWERRAQIASESTFSRAFDEFAAGELPQQIHEALVKKELGEKLIGHVSHDSTAIDGREKPAPKAVKSEPAAKKRGRAEKGQGRRAAKRLELQPRRTLQENVAELPRLCDRGCKRGSKGTRRFWVGYKLHLSTGDGEIPLGAILSSASLHDSQAAVPLLQMTAQRVSSLYDLMDSAYDAAAIDGFSRALGHEPIIDPAGRGKHEPAPLAPARVVRYRERTAAERVNSDLLDNHGGRMVRVRGAAKVMCHLMWGVLVVTVKGLVRLLE